MLAGSELFAVGTIDFVVVFTLCLVTLLNLFIKLLCSSIVVLQIFYVNIVIYKESFISHFVIFLPFICFSYLISAVWPSRMILNRSGESGHSSLIFDLTEKQSNRTPLSVLLTVGFVYCFLILSACHLSVSGHFLQLLV